jgi:citrate synthase
MSVEQSATDQPTASGLDGIVVARTALSDVDGEMGRLVIRGHSIEELVEKSTFEDVCGLMWNGVLPGVGERESLRAALGRARRDAFALLPSLGNALVFSDGMESLRAAAGHVPDTKDAKEGAIRLTGALAVFATAWARVRAGQPPVAPEPSLPHAADYLQMLSGLPPDPSRVAGLDAYLCCVVDHGLNASTFAARVVASTGSDLVSAVVAAIGALKGPLHGGAPGPVLDMLDAIGDASHARPWLEAELSAGRRIMGMGHRMYRVRDPRAAALERAASVLERSRAATDRLTLARAVEREAERVLAERHPERRLRANVEFYTAVLLEAVGVPRTLFSSTFAASRVVGWCAHVDEQVRVGRLIRPGSTYVGPAVS